MIVREVRTKMYKSVLALTLTLSPSLVSAETAQERLQVATQVFQEIMTEPDKGISQDLLERAHCVVIIPGMKSGAFIIGGKYGRGFATCRNAKHTGWGAPGAVRAEGGTFGLQIGGKETDVVMLVMNKSGMEKLLSSKFTLGGEASIAAGPVGRTGAAQTDAYMRAEILSWSRSRGVFAGLALAGATLRNDLDENAELYGKKLTNKEVIMSEIKPPAAAQPLLAVLSKYSFREEGSSADRVKK
jgi:lipid-binding SYLF domain-containing protein